MTFIFFLLAGTHACAFAANASLSAKLADASNVPDVLLDTADSSAAARSTGIGTADISERVEDAVQKAQDSSLIDDVLKSLQSNLDDALPTPIAGLAPTPSVQDVRDLKEQAMRAQQHRERLEAALRGPVKVPQKCVECQKFFEATHDEALLPRAEATEKAAKKRFQEASVLAAAEAKREKELPALALAMQRQANYEHQRRIDAQRMALKAKLVRIKAEKAENERLEGLRQTVARQRFIDRLRAAEDARVAACAMKAAAKARQKLRLKAHKGEAASVQNATSGVNAEFVQKNLGLIEQATNRADQDLGQADDATILDAGKAVDAMVAETIKDFKQEPAGIVRLRSLMSQQKQGAASLEQARFGAARRLADVLSTGSVNAVETLS